MPAFSGYLALGAVDPVTGAFTELSGAGGYARQAVTLNPAANETGTSTFSGALTLTADVAFPTPTGADWTGITGYAIYAASTGGTPLLWWRIGGEQPRTARVATSALTAKPIKVEAVKIGLRPATKDTVTGQTLYASGALAYTAGVLTLGGGLSYSPTPVASGAASGAAAGSLSSTLQGSVSYSVLSGALAVNGSTGALTTTGTAPSSGAIAAKVRAQTSTDAIETTIAVPIQAPAPVLATLTFSPSSPSVALSAAAGTTVATIGAKTAGSTLSISPNDGRYALAGDDTNGWRVVVGLTASSAGTDNLSVVETLAGATGSPKGTALAAVRSAGLPTFAFQAETQAIVAAYSAVGPTPSLGLQQMMDRVVRRWKASGAWAKMTWACDGRWSANEAQSQINWINPSQSMTKVGTPTFTAGSGWSTTAATSKYRAPVAMTAMTPLSNHQGVYSLTANANASTAVDAGAQDASNNGYVLACQTTTNFMSARTGGPIGTTANAGFWDGAGWHCANRVDNTGFAAAHRGPVKETVSVGTATITDSSRFMSLLSADGNSSFTSRTIAFWHFGTGLTTGQTEDVGASLQDWVEGPMKMGQPFINEAGYAPQNVTADVLCYGSSMPSIIAAYAAKRFNPALNVILVCEEGVSSPWRLGGMLAQGLDLADLDTTSTTNKFVTGIWRDALSVLNTLNSRTDTQPVTQAIASIDARSWNGVARRMLDPNQSTGLLPGLNIPVYYTGGAVSVAKTGTRITGMTTADGRTFTCKAVYGGDYLGILMTMAGIPYTKGAEAASTGTMESQAGYRAPATLPKYGASSAGGVGTVAVRVDPYVTPATPASGLLPDLQLPNGLTVGAADPNLVQSMNYRMTLNNSALRGAGINRLGAPAGYSVARYERHLRGMAAATAAGQTPTNFDMLSYVATFGSALDANNGGCSFSTDLPGSGAAYLNAGSAAARAAIAQDIRNYDLGFFYMLTNSGDARIPSAITTTFNGLSLSTYNFTDPEPGGLLWFPDQPYIRQPLLMNNSGAKLNGDDCAAVDGTTPRISTNIISYAAYPFDRHDSSQVAYDDGSGMAIFRQGGGLTGSSGGADKQIPIPMEICWPDRASCSNYATTTHWSVSNIAWTCVRLEAVMGVAAEGAGIALALVAANNNDIQDTDYAGTLWPAIAAAPDTYPVYKKAGGLN